MKDERNAWAPDLTDAREARSISRNVMATSGYLVLRSEIRSLARVAERPVKKIREGLWAPRERTVCLPSPAVPVIFSA